MSFIVIEGNATEDASLREFTSKRTEQSVPISNVTVAVNDRRYNAETDQWVDTGRTFYEVTVSGRAGHPLRWHRDSRAPGSWSPATSTSRSTATTRATPASAAGSAPTTTASAPSTPRPSVPETVTQLNPTAGERPPAGWPLPSHLPIEVSQSCGSSSAPSCRSQARVHRRAVRQRRPGRSPRPRAEADGRVEHRGQTAGRARPGPGGSDVLMAGAQQPSSSSGCSRSRSGSARAPSPTSPKGGTCARTDCRGRAQAPRRRGSREVSTRRSRSDAAPDGLRSERGGPGRCQIAVARSRTAGSRRVLQAMPREPPSRRPRPPRRDGAGLTVGSSINYVMIRMWCNAAQTSQLQSVTQLRQACRISHRLTRTTASCASTAVSAHSSPPALPADLDRLPRDHLRAGEQHRALRRRVADRTESGLATQPPAVARRAAGLRARRRRPPAAQPHAPRHQSRLELAGAFCVLAWIAETSASWKISRQSGPLKSTEKQIRAIVAGPVVRGAMFGAWPHRASSSDGSSTRYWTSSAATASACSSKPATIS